MLDYFAIVNKGSIVKTKMEISNGFLMKETAPTNNASFCTAGLPLMKIFFKSGYNFNNSFVANPSKV